MGKRFATFYRCLAFARFWKVKFWRSFIKCQYFNDGWMDFHKNIYLYMFILGVFSKTRKTRVSHRVKIMTRWPRWERWPKWPTDPVTQFHVWFISYASQLILFLSLFPYLSPPLLIFSFKKDPLRLNLTLVFLCLFCVPVHFFWLMNACCFCCVRFSFFHAKPRDCLHMAVPVSECG